MDKIDEVLTRGVDKIYPTREALEKVLRSGKKITLYLGIDPSGDKLHIGHAVGLRKLRQFQDLGHHVILLIADFTGMIGDPTGKKEGRKQLTLAQVHENAKFYKDQASRIIRFTGEKAIETRNNSEWLAKLNFEDILNLASHFTVQQMIERDMFQERLKRGDEIHLHEFFYPLMQGYDSVAMNVDLELGGSDQTFNMLAGRKLVAQFLHKEKFVMTVPLLSDSKGNKIGKTEGNAIGLTDPPNEFFAKIMSLSDDSIVPCFTLLTDIPMIDIDNMKQQMKTGAANPMTFKLQLAHHLTAWLNSKDAADAAQKDFGNRFQKGELSQADIPVFLTEKSKWNLIDLLMEAKLVDSKSEARRLITEHAVKQNGAASKEQLITLTNGDIIKIGKKRFAKIKIL